MSNEVQKCSDDFNYFLVPLFTNNNYQNQDLENSLVVEYEQKYFIPKDTEITYDSKKIKLMEDVEVKLNSGNVEISDESTLICLVGSKEIDTTGLDNNVFRRAKKQLYEIPIADD